jgi:hypothetical protein
MVYCQAVFSRGAGLGTRLFPWARCVLFAHANNIPMLAPQWVQPRIGPLLRGGIDIRAYHRQILLAGLFRQPPGAVGGLARLRALLASARVEEPARIDEPYGGAGTGMRSIITFRGAGTLFECLNGRDQFLLRTLREITKPRWLEFADSVGSVPIGINVRLGNDFRVARSDEDYQVMGALKTPMTWFVDGLRWIRDTIGYAARALVVSDGTREQLKPLLDQGNVEFVRPGCAISDLLILVRSQVLLASGGSSFSAWASFLGQMPTISHPGQPMSWFRLLNRHGYHTGEFDIALPNREFAEQVRAMLGDGR